MCTNAIHSSTAISRYITILEVGLWKYRRTSVRLYLEIYCYLRDALTKQEVPIHFMGPWIFSLLLKKLVIFLFAIFSVFPPDY